MEALTGPLALVGLILTVLTWVIFWYFCYRVIKAAVRDGMREAQGTLPVSKPVKPAPQPSREVLGVHRRVQSLNYPEGNVARSR